LNSTTRTVATRPGPRGVMASESRGAAVRLVTPRATFICYRPGLTDGPRRSGGCTPTSMTSPRCPPARRRALHGMTGARCLPPPEQCARQPPPAQKTLACAALDRGSPAVTWARLQANQRLQEELVDALEAAEAARGAAHGADGGAEESAGEHGAAQSTRDELRAMQVGVAMRRPEWCPGKTACSLALSRAHFTHSHFLQRLPPQSHTGSTAGGEGGPRSGRAPCRGRFRAAQSGCCGSGVHSSR
jgi:hypothetical protein